MPETGWVTIALLGKTRGNRGEVTAVALSSKPERYQALQEVFLFGPGGFSRAARDTKSNRPGSTSGPWFSSSAASIPSPTPKLLYGRGGARSCQPAHRRSIEGEYFQSDLIGCEVVDRRTGESLGRVTRLGRWRRLRPAGSRTTC